MEPTEMAACRLAHENPGWGCDRIAGALHNLGHGISDETFGSSLHRHGILPAPGRKAKVPWADVIVSHQDTLVAADFIAAEVLTPIGLLALPGGQTAQAIPERALRVLRCDGA